MAKIEIPDAPAGLPDKVAKEWKKTYEASFKEAQNDFPDDTITQKEMALRDANRILKTPELTSYSQAMSLDDWHFVRREHDKDGKTLRVTTRHGKKFYFDVPAKTQKAIADATGAPATSEATN
jgi:hypothetical protein